MTRKDYIKFADMMGRLGKEESHDRDTLRAVIDELCRVFKQDNSRFNEETFREYVAKVFKGEK